MTDIEQKLTERLGFRVTTSGQIVRDGVINRDGYWYKDIAQLWDALCAAERENRALRELVEKLREGIEQAAAFAGAQCGWDKARALETDMDTLLTLTPEQAEKETV